MGLTTIIQNSIGRAVAEWTTALGMIVGKNLKLCEAGVGDCDVTNHDNGIVTVKTVSINTKDTNPGDSSKHEEGCGWSIACIKSDSGGQGNHQGHMSLIFEEPAWQCRRDQETDVNCTGGHPRIYWTDIEGDHGDPGPTVDSEYYFVDIIMIHEFGHTIGLPDFYGDKTGLDRLPAVMYDPYTHRTPNDEDIAQLRAIYAIHESTFHNVPGP